MKLHNLLPPYGEKHKVKRLGRGNSSGSGNYSGKGMKGQGSRKGRGTYLGFEGGQMPLYRRLPKRGFTPLNKERYQEVNLCSLNSLKDEKEITPEILRKKGLIKKVNEKIKILGKGTLELTLVVKAHKFSRKAKEEIVKKGGKAIEIVSYTSKPKIDKEEVERNKVTVKESLAEKEQKTKGKEKTEIEPKIIKRKKSLKSEDKAKTKGKKKDK
ncbi:50S ribosomal protein L15 [bacterium]|nr:50S ribosomal protein L15 [bacterium]